MKPDFLVQKDFSILHPYAVVFLRQNVTPQLR
jgi:hypothetical protein